jgi:hypothetical protein
VLGVAKVQLMIELGSDDCPRIDERIWEIPGLAMDLADAALVRVAEVNASGGCHDGPAGFRNLPALSAGLLPNPGLIGAWAPFSSVRSHA